jgi:3-carboxy-cis,cis-muconate cycloisomerase
VLPAQADAGLLDPAWATTPVADLTSDAAVVAAMLQTEVALAAGLADHGIVAGSAVDAIAAVDVSDLDPARIAQGGLQAGNPVVPFLTDLRGRVADIDPDAVSAVHCGATSQDILDTALMLVASRTATQIEADLERIGAALARLADGHRGTVLPARTLTQHAVPMTFGLKAARWLDGVLDGYRRLDDVRSGLPAQFGGAAGTLASLATATSAETAAAVADTFADRLGVARPGLPWHTNRSPITALGDALAAVVDAVATVAADVATGSRTEIGELTEPSGGSSSAMPQKHNPVRSVLINSAHTQTGPLAGILHSAAAPVDERPAGAWHAEWPTLVRLVRLAGGAAHHGADLAEGLQVHPDRMRANTDTTGGLIVSERLLTELSSTLGTDTVRDLVRRAGAGADLRGLLTDALARNPGALGDTGDAESRADELLDPTRYTGASDVFIDRVLDVYRAHMPQDCGSASGFGKDMS